MSIQIPRVSVVIPTFQAESFLAETLASIAAQTVSIDQLVISDDGSSDRTHAIVEQFKSENSTEVRFTSHQQIGPTANFLNGLKYADGDLIIVSDQDDVWLGNKVAKVIEGFESEGVALVCHDSLLVDDKLAPLGSTIRGGLAKSAALATSINESDAQNNIRLFLRGGLPLLAHTLAFRKPLVPLLLNKPTDTADWWFEEWLSCIAMTQGRLHFLKEHLILYRQHNQQTSGGFKKRYPLSGMLIQKDSESKYASRIKKFSYCEQLMRSTNKDDSRIKVVVDYLAFLSARDAAIESSSIFIGARRIFATLQNGAYAVFAKGLKSAVLDLNLVIKGGKRAK